MTTLVIYHADCYDGFTAAWIARQAMPDCELFEGRHGEDPPYELAHGRNVYVLDFSYPRMMMVKLNLNASQLLVLDHHKTAQANCEGLPFCEFDMERSGAGMAWEYFFRGAEHPAWIERVEDRDLWRFKLSCTAEVHAFIASFPMTMENWDTLNRLPIYEHKRRGEAINRYIETSISKSVKAARLVVFGNNNVVVLNVPYQNASETADSLLKSFPAVRYSLTYFQRADSCWQYSLRSRSDFDVSEIAKSHGGGGHAQAAGFDTESLLGELL